MSCYTPIVPSGHNICRSVTRLRRPVAPVAACLPLPIIMHSKHFDPTDGGGRVLGFDPPCTVYAFTYVHVLQRTRTHCNTIQHCNPLGTTDDTCVYSVYSVTEHRVCVRTTSVHRVPKYYTRNDFLNTIVSYLTPYSDRIWEYFNVRIKTVTGLNFYG